MGSHLPSPLRGVVPPLITPLKDRDLLDHEGLERLLEYILAGGVHGIFILGTTGEGPSLSYRLRCELIEMVCHQVDGRVPVLVGVTDTALTESINIAEHAADEGADGVVLAAPYYFPAGQPELLEYLQHIVPQLPLPVFLYNMPSCTKIAMDLETVRRSLDWPNVVGLKDSSGNMEYFQKVRSMTAGRSDFTLLIGPELLLAESVLLGGDGGVCGGANLSPRLFVALYEAAAAGDLPRVKQLHRLVLRIAETIYSVGRHGSAYLKGIKCALSLLGVCDDAMAEPFSRFQPAQREQVRRWLDELAVSIQAGGIPVG